MSAPSPASTPTRSTSNGDYIPLVFRGRDRLERHEELIAYSIQGGISQARIAHATRQGEGRIHMNVLWEMGSCERVLQGVLDGAKGLIHGVTCGAGMPYRLARDLRPLRRPLLPDRLLGPRLQRPVEARLPQVPGLARGRGLRGPLARRRPQRPVQRREPAASRESPFPRVLELRKLMRAVGLDHVPIVMAGGVWHLEDWKDWIGNPELGPIAFQFGTRPLLTRESPIPESWKKRLLELLPGDVLLHRFSPTGFYSSAVKNRFLDDLVGAVGPAGGVRRGAGPSAWPRQLLRLRPLRATASI